MMCRLRPFGFLLLAALGAIAALTGCEDEENNIVVPEQVITVSITADADSLASGGTARLIAVATTTAGDPLIFTWSADQGEFTATEDDTTYWTAPDAAGLYDIAVLVTDGKNVAIGTKVLGVDTYVPAVTPYYRGATYCQTCHGGGTAGDQYTTWVASAHAGAWNTLDDIGNGRNATCLPCHTVGAKAVNADPELDNGGYDETAVARLQGVQCENCHGPGSQHPTAEFGSVDVVMQASMCGSCHNGPHHPTYEEWQTSPHNSVIALPAGRTSCVKCHNGAYAYAYLDDPAGFTNPAAVADTLEITCAVCHDPHGGGTGNPNPGQLRNASVTDVVLPDGTVVPEAGAGRLCMACHNGRRTQTNISDMINNGSSHFGPHHSVQGDMLAGTGAYEGLAPSFPWTSSRHLMVEDGCVHCHTHRHGEGTSTFTGHDFRPNLTACQECHGTLNSFDSILAKQDYDGDAAIEGVQSEVAGLKEILRLAVIGATHPDSTADRLAFETDFVLAVGDTNVSSRAQREAGYNWCFVDFDGSSGVHNTTYAIQLLQQSTLYINPGKMPERAFILRE
jgi:hypothetical protein